MQLDAATTGVLVVSAAAALASALVIGGEGKKLVPSAHFLATVATLASAAWAWTSLGEPIRAYAAADEPALHRVLIQGMLAFFGLSAVTLLAGIEAPYGRYAAGAHPLFGIEVPGKVAWVLQELPNLVMSGLCLAHADPKALESPANMILLSLFTAHYINRTLIFPFLIRGGKNTTFVPFLMATAFCTVNGFVQGRQLTHLHVYDRSWLFDPRFLVGTALFCVGVKINTDADRILRNLRKPGETGYKIPRGGMFEYVSGANFFGEIVEWTGFAIASWSAPAACFAACTAMNIGPRAIQHHAWYQRKFADTYPRERKAIIPFLF